MSSQQSAATRKSQVKGLAIENVTVTNPNPNKPVAPRWWHGAPRPGSRQPLWRSGGPGSPQRSSGPPPPPGAPAAGSGCAQAGPPPSGSPAAPPPPLCCSAGRPETARATIGLRGSQGTESMDYTLNGKVVPSHTIDWTTKMHVQAKSQLWAYFKQKNIDAANGTTLTVPYDPTPWQAQPTRRPKTFCWTEDSE